MTLRDDRAEYEALLPDLERLRDFLVESVKVEAESNSLRLAAPIEGRVKTWDSILGKIKRRPAGINDFREFQDLVGLRIVVLFSQDVPLARRIALASCYVVKGYDTAQRLEEDRFGYRASHFIVRPHPLRTKLSFPDVDAEIQIRTAAQHVWAQASHILQYKTLEATPPALHRSVNRLAALAELVDFEFERLLGEREEYRRSLQMEDDSLILDVEVLGFALPRLWSSDHEESPEIYGSVLNALKENGICTLGDLRRLVATQRSSVFADSLAHADELLDAVDKGVKQGNTYTISTDRSSRSHSSVTPEMIERARRGVFYSLSGLTFTALQFAFGERQAPPGTRTPFPRPAG